MADREKTEVGTDLDPQPGSTLRSPELTNNDPPTVLKTNTAIITSSIEAGSGTNRPDGAETSRSELMPVAGLKIGNYELGPPIGIGGMATVYAARDLSLERMVALKILPPKSSQDSEVLQRFLFEGKAAAQLDHPNIARIHALGHDGIYYYLAFEYVEGRTVRQWIDDRGYVDIDHVLDWSSQVADALAHADHRGVVHRDIKPSNLIVTPGGQVKLVDLGLARRYESQGHVDLTQSGVTLGTFDYISPEQARDPRNVDIRSDLYSLGCTMFHMLAGAPPFPGQNVVQKLLQHQEKQPPDLGSINPQVPPGLSALVARLMSKSPADRPASAEICSKDLKELILSRKNPVLSPLPSILPGSNALQWMKMWLVPPILLASILILVAWLAGNRPSTNEWVRDQSAGTSGRSTSNLSSQSGLTDTGGEWPDQPILKPRQTSPQNYRVSDGQALVNALNEAAPGSVITLTQAGPYRLNHAMIKPIEHSDLTIKSDQGLMAVIVPEDRSPEDQSKGAGDRILLRFSDSRIQLYGIIFDLRGESGGWFDAAIAAEECDLVVRDVRILADQNAEQDSTAFISLKTNRLRAEKLAWRPVRIENCRFLGPRVAVNANGPVDLSISESAHLSSEPLIWLESDEKETPWPCFIQLDHVSVMATGWTPILELNSASARIRARDCIFAPRPGGQISLVSSRRPSRVDWFGRGNVFGEVTTFLESTRFDEEILDFDTWTKSDSMIREQGSQATKQSVYAPSDSTILAAKGRWADAFALNRGPWSNFPAGVRGWSDSINSTIASSAGPTNLLNPAEKLSSPTFPEKPLENSELLAKPDAVALQIPMPNSNSSGSRESPELLAKANTPMPMPMPMQVETRSENEPDEITGRTDSNRSQAADRPQKNLSVEELAANNNRTSEAVDIPAINRVQPGPNRPVNVENPEDTASVREVVEAREFQEAIRTHQATGAAISLAAGGLVGLNDVLNLKTGNWLFNAEPGAVRPRLIFKNRNQALVENLARWTIESGVSVRLRGLDIEWDANEPAQERLFEVMTGAQLILEDCTLTMRGVRSDLILFALAGPELAQFEEPNSQKAKIRLIDSFVRTSGGLFRTPGNIRCELELTGTLAVIGRSLLTILAPERLESAQSSRLQMIQTTAVLGTNLATIFQGRGPGKPPHLECQLRRTIVASDSIKENPLLEVRDGDPNQLENECITWEADEIGYHHWQTYRLDQNDLSGKVAQRQNREAWELSHAAQETQAHHGDLGFIRDLRTIRRPIWESLPADYAIQAASPSQALGARIEQLPRVSLPMYKTETAGEFPQEP